jgi:hypothetical protein
MIQISSYDLVPKVSNVTVPAAWQSSMCTSELISEVNNYDT